MKNIGLYRLVVVLSAIIAAMFGCIRRQAHVLTPNQTPFEIDSLYKMIHLPVKINDSVTARMAFDTGCSWGYFDLDSTFCAQNRLPLWNRQPTVITPTHGVIWGTEPAGGFTYFHNDDFVVGIGVENIDYCGLSVWNQVDYRGPSDNYYGLFTIPKTDTAHVWELNFEHNYLELHDAEAFTMPEDCLIAPMNLNEHQMRVTIPMKITTSDGETLTVEREFLVDSGMGWDVGIFVPAEEFSFFDGKEAVPFGYGGGGYVSRYITDAEIFDGHRMDELRVYTLKEQAASFPTSYWIGLNFLKRFNVYFDVRNARMGLQPLKKFTRAFSPVWRRFNMDTERTERGTYIVKELGEHDLNHYKKAGMRVGDEIVGFGGAALTPETTAEQERELLDKFEVRIDILRDGKPLTLTMRRDPNEVQGD